MRDWDEPFSFEYTLEKVHKATAETCEWGFGPSRCSREAAFEFNPSEIYPFPVRACREHVQALAMGTPPKLIVVKQ